MHARNPRAIAALVVATLIALASGGTAGESRAAGDQSGTPHPAAEPLSYQPTLLVQLGVTDLDRSVAFYTDTMGFTLESRDDDLEWVRIDPGVRGVTIGLGRVDTVAPSDQISMNFAVADLGAARTALESRGVTFRGPTVKIPGVVQLADLEDPDGHRIRLAAHPPGFGAPDDDATPAEAADDPLASLAWLEGQWEGEHASRSWEEHWTRSDAGAIVGMFRMINAGAPVVYEILLIETGENGAPVYRLRHFGANMKAWEDQPLVFDQVQADAREILFKNRDPEHGPTYIRYTRHTADVVDVWVGATPTPSDKGFTLPLRRVRD